jgi:hypothetical protein
MFIYTLRLPPTGASAACLSALLASNARSVLLSCGCAVCACIGDFMSALSESYTPNEIHVHKRYLDNTFVELEQDGESFSHSYRTFITGLLEEHGYQPYLETMAWLRFTRPPSPLP